MNVTVQAHIFSKRKDVRCEDGTEGCYAAGYAKGSDVYFYRKFVAEATLHALDKLALHEVCHVATGRYSNADPEFLACEALDSEGGQ